MKKLILLMLLAAPTFAQAPQPSSPPCEIGCVPLTPKQQRIQQVCKATEITSGSEVDKVDNILHKLRPGREQRYPEQRHIYVALIDSNVINASTYNSSIDSLICLPIAMVHFMGDGEGELAFVLSHEIGHAVDDQCKTKEGRMAVWTRLNTVTAQQACEQRADAIGFNLFTSAGYNPYDAAGAFGRLEMYSGDINTGIVARLLQFGSDHPMTPDRISSMRKLLIEYAHLSARN